MRETLGLTVMFGALIAAGAVWIWLDQSDTGAFAGLVVIIAGVLWARRLT